MRDPQGHTAVGKQQVTRHLTHPLPDDHFLKSPAARTLVDQGVLIDYAFEDAVTVSSPTTQFVSYPHEWTDAHLSDAASLTLRLAEAALSAGWELKDASAWNIVFNGTAPQFCDHLSFQRIERKQWWAFAQYARHFVLPLCLSRSVGLDIGQSFKLFRDGIPPDAARRFLGARRFLTPCWPLLAPSKRASTLGPANASKALEPTAAPHHANLFALLRWLLRRVGQRRTTTGVWSGYAASRTHYSNAEQAAKHATVSSWVDRTRPTWVIDYGCNTGEFSVLAASKGSRVISIDLDHDSVRQLYATQSGNRLIHPLVADLDDLAGGRGWTGTEFPGLVDRLARVGEMSLMLALIHHLAISNSIPYARIAALARATSSKWLIVEFLDANDPLVQLLCSQRNRNPADFSLEQQLLAFAAFFNVLDSRHESGTTRHLYLFEVRQ